MTLLNQNRQWILILKLFIIYFDAAAVTTLYLILLANITVHFVQRFFTVTVFRWQCKYTHVTGVGSGGGGGGGGGQGGHVPPPPTFLTGGAIVCLCPSTFNPTFLFST